MDIHSSCLYAIVLQQRLRMTLPRRTRESSRLIEVSLHDSLDAGSLEYGDGSANISTAPRVARMPTAPRVAHDDLTRDTLTQPRNDIAPPDATIFATRLAVPIRLAGTPTR